MAIIRMVTVSCDLCGMPADASGWTSAEAKIVAKDLGWRCASKDICPDCQEES